MALSVIVFIPLFWKEALGYSQSTVGFMNGIGVALALAAPICSGWMGAKYSPHKIIFVSFLFYSVGSLLFLGGVSLPYQIAVFVLFTFSRWGVFTLVPVGVLQTLSESAGRDYGRYRRFGSIGFLLGILGLGYLSDRSSIEIVFSVVAIVALVAALPFATKLSIPVSQDRSIRYRQLLRRPPVLFFLVIAGFIASSNSLTFVYLPLRLREMGASNSLVALVMSLCGVTATLSFPWAGRFSDRHNASLIVRVVVVCTTLRMVSLALPETNPEWVILLQLGHIPTWVLFDAFTIKYIKDVVSSEEFAKMQALCHVAHNIGLAIGSLIAAGLLVYFQLRVTYVLSAPLPLLALFFIRRLESGR